MRPLMMLALGAAALVGAQALTAAPAEAGWGGYHAVVVYPAPCCCAPRFGYYKTSQYWPAPRRAVRKYFRLVSYPAVRVRGH